MSLYSLMKSRQIQVAWDGNFLNLEHDVSDYTDTRITLFVAPNISSHYYKYWRVRAKDIAGTYSAWSEPLKFRIYKKDGIDHASGDKSCAFGVAR